MKTIWETAQLEDQPYNGFKNLYQAMCVKQDFTNYGDTLFYKKEELELEVV